jgi:hypothetical protein
MKQRICSQCAYSVCDPAFWMRQVTLGWPATLMCVNTPEAPGRLRPVSPNGTCRNFFTRHDPSYRLPPVEPATGDIRFIPLTQGKFAIVDAADYEWLSQYKWCTVRNGNRTYAFRMENGKRFLMHREIMKTPKGKVVDHMDNNGIDNRRGNMRNCSPRQNSWSRREGHASSSQYRGVYRCWGKWGAQVGHLWRHIHVGLFNEEIEAARARDRKAIELHGKYAHLNLPEEWPPEKREALYNSPEAVQARAEANRRSAKVIAAKRKAARAKPKSKPKAPRPRQRRPKSKRPRAATGRRRQEGAKVRR